MKPKEPCAQRKELLRELDVHDDLVAKCARGDMSFSEFERAYVPPTPQDAAQALIQISSDHVARPSPLDAIRVRRARG